MKYEQNKADPCLYHKWIDGKLLIWITWVGGCLIAGAKDEVMKAKDKMMSLFDCDDVGEMKEYVGCKVEHNRSKGEMKVTQPVMVRSFEDEFGVKLEGHIPTTPVEQGLKLTEADEGTELDMSKQTKYRSGIGKLLHMMRCTRPNIMNAVREASRHMMKANERHMKAMMRIMKYCSSTGEEGLIMKPNKK